MRIIPVVIRVPTYLKMVASYMNCRRAYNGGCLMDLLRTVKLIWVHLAAYASGKEPLK